MILPEIKSEEDYRAVFANTDTWMPAMRVLCERHGLDAGDLRRTTLGSHVVFRTEDRIVKLFAGIWSEDFVSERAALANIRGLPVPELIAEGELEGWPYMVMSFVSGTPALEVSEELGEEERIGVVRQLGEMMRQLHESPFVPELATDWGALMKERIARADEHHGAEEPWRGWIRERLAGFEESPFDPVLLSADITEDHLLLSEEGGQWKITGFIDFGDAMMGHPHYEFVAPLCFYTFGQPKLSRVLVEAYGLRLTAERADRLTTYCLLHEFGRLKDFLRRYPAKDGPGFHRALWGDL